MAKKVATKKKPSEPTTPKVRRLKAPKYKSFRLSKTIKHPGTKMVGSFRLFWRSLLVLKKNWKLFGGILVVYGVLMVVFVRGFSGGMNLSELKAPLSDLFGGGTGQIGVGVTLFGLVLGSSGTATSDIASLYQTILILLGSLAYIWALRQVFSTNKKDVGIKNAFYKSTYALVPFLLVLLVICLQLIPLLAGASVYSTVINNGLAATFTEQFLWALLFFFMALLSLYMVSSSIFALYIVTLPDMTPMKALRSAREIVRYRRWTVLRKVLFLPVALLLMLALIMIPLILYVTPAAQWAYFVLSLASLAVLHSYMYSLYRELL